MGWNKKYFGVRGEKFLRKSFETMLKSDRKAILKHLEVRIISKKQKLILIAKISLKFR